MKVRKGRALYTLHRATLHQDEEAAKNHVANSMVDRGLGGSMQTLVGGEIPKTAWGIIEIKMLDTLLKAGLDLDMHGNDNAAGIWPEDVDEDEPLPPDEGVDEPDES